MTKIWWKAALIRAVKTMAQTATALIGSGAVGFTDLDWIRILSISGVAGLLSLFTSIGGLPEVE
ncbi:MAG TPA: holin [Clostridia bacterium]|nr:holin [Clostridia bacterium]